MITNSYERPGSAAPGLEPLHFRPALAPRAHAPAEIRILWINPAQALWSDTRLGEFHRILRPGDLLVVNDAATLPASIPAQTEDGLRVEIRLAAERDNSIWDAVLFGDGDWHDRTEDRAAPPPLAPGATLELEGGSKVSIVAASEISPRLVRIRFDRDAPSLWEMLYRLGKPVQYSHVERSLDLWDVQTPYGARPWAVEPPSAGLALTWGTIARVRARGVRLAYITHAAGLSSTGDPSLDAALPLDERYEIPEATVRVVVETRRAGKRVIAVGTTVVRALEGSAETNGGFPVAGRGVTGLRLHRHFQPRIIDGLLTGIHEPGTSHYELMEAFADPTLIGRALVHAADLGYLTHEFGDLSLILG
jgi:S-adenosylmethionine:tRNA ribosyltransferase-isomerase